MYIALALGGGGHWTEWRKYISNVTFLIYNKNCYFDIYSPKNPGKKIIIHNWLQTTKLKL